MSSQTRRDAAQRAKEKSERIAAEKADKTRRLAGKAGRKLLQERISMREQGGVSLARELTPGPGSEASL